MYDACTPDVDVTNDANWQGLSCDDTGWFDCSIVRSRFAVTYRTAVRQYHQPKTAFALLELIATEN